MLVCMRTTMNLPDALLAEAKQRAAHEGRTLTSFVEEALRARLQEAGEAPPTTVDLPTWDGGEMLVDITDRDALWAALDDRP